VSDMRKNGQRSLRRPIFERSEVCKYEVDRLTSEIILTICNLQWQLEFDSTNRRRRDTVQGKKDKEKGMPKRGLLVRGFMLQDSTSAILRGCLRATM